MSKIVNNSMLLYAITYCKTILNFDAHSSRLNLNIVLANKTQFSDHQWRTCPPQFPRGRLSNFLKSVEKPWGGGLIFIHLERLARMECSIFVSRTNRRFKPQAVCVGRALEAVRRRRLKPIETNNGCINSCDTLV